MSAGEDTRKGLSARTRNVRRDAMALFLALGDRRVPWYARLLAAAVVAYAFSPIDLIPDFIPVLGYLDDLLIIPAGVLLVRGLIPAPVLAEHRAAADRIIEKPRFLLGAAVIIMTWLAIGLLAAWLLIRSVG